MATSGTLPASNDIIRLSARAAPSLPAGTWLRVIRTRSCTIAAWTYVDVHVLDAAGRPVLSTSVLVPVASITRYPEGITSPTDYRS
jgi:D-serine deaminase-like pyridoxal phosphate-dependent protein